MFIKSLALVLTSTALLACGAASAGVSNFTIGGTYSQGGPSSDLPATSISLGGAGSFVLDPGSSGAFFDFSKPGNGTFSTTSTSASGYFYLASYAAGTLINASNVGTQVSPVDDWDTILVNDVAMGAWNASHSGFLGFVTASNNYGYVQYDFTRANSISTITFLSGAYETVAGEGILTPGGTVPEPASLALLGVGLAGITAMRRKSAKKHV